ncbi:MAG: NAD-dependent epimerase/dehydratase family protein [Planctomycetes bacterium]|nr:NAD-dependent epimerase/dehydratase family protein [Planctomycetota bacterium]
MATGPVLLTGGTGYLGRWILRALRARGLPVRLLARDPARAADLAAPGVEVVRGDVTDRASVEAACRGAASVVHAAATVSSWERDPRTFDRVNVEGLRTVALAAAAAGAAPLVLVSSFFALGPTDGITGDETLPLSGARRFSNDYERTKTLAEAEARELLARGHPVVTLYPGVLYGPGPLREANLVGTLLVEAGAGRLRGLPGGGDRRWCFTFVEDAGEGVVRALERAAPGDRYVLGGENATLREFFDRAAEAGGPAVPRRSLPYAALGALGAASEILAGLGGPRPRVTRGAAAIFRREWAYSSRRAERALGWRSRPLAEGIPPTLADLRAQGRIP